MATVAARQPVLKISSPDLLRDLDLTDDEVQALLDSRRQRQAHARRSMRRRWLAATSRCCSKSLRCARGSPSSWPSSSSAATPSLSDGPIGEREPVKDVARNLDRWMQRHRRARVFAADTIEELAQLVARAGDQRPERSVSSLPGAGRCADAAANSSASCAGLKLAFVGDGNNVAHSLMLTAARLGMDFAIATPARLRAECRHRGAGRGARRAVRRAR